MAKAPGLDVTAKTAVRLVSDVVYAARFARSSRRWRVLLYHRVVPAPPPRDLWSVSTATFEAQLAVLRNLGYDVMDAGDVAAWLDGRSGPDAKRQVLIAFDDGYRSAREHALPILHRLGHHAVFFLVPAAMGTTSAWEGPMGLAPSPIMSWGEAAELVASGMSIGSHSLTHRDLTTLGDAELEREARQSRDELEQRLGTAVRAFSVPFGRDDLRLDRHLGTAGYRLKISYELLRPGVRAGLRSILCTPVLSRDSPREFRKKLAGAYDWSHLYLRWYWRLGAAAVRRV